MSGQMEFHSAPPDVVAKIAARVSFVDCTIHDVDQVPILAPDIDVS